MQRAGYLYPSLSLPSFRASTEHDAAIHCTRVQCVVAGVGLEPTNPKEEIYSLPQLPLCEPAIMEESDARNPSFRAIGYTTVRQAPPSSDLSLPPPYRGSDCGCAKGGTGLATCALSSSMWSFQRALLLSCPIRFHVSFDASARIDCAGVTGLEPATYGFGDRCSSN